MAFDETVSKAITRKANELNWPAKAFAAAVTVQSGGRAFSKVGGQQMPLIHYDYHIFHRNLPKPLRAEAVKRGLAAPYKGELPFKKTQSARYGQLERAAELHSEAAHMACCWGVGQVPGESAMWLGFPSARAMAEQAIESIDGQLDIMARFIIKRGLVDELTRRNWRGFIRIYNGAGQVQHYAQLMAQAYRRLGGQMPRASDLDDDVILQVGASGDAVATLQRNLQRLGHHVVADGDFGPATKSQVTTFQQAQDFVANGVVGPATLGRLETLIGRDVIAGL